VLEKFVEYVRSCSNQIPNPIKIEDGMLEKLWYKKGIELWLQFNILSKLVINAQEGGPLLLDNRFLSDEDKLFGPDTIFEGKDPEGFLNIYGGIDFLIRDDLNILNLILFAHPNYHGADDIQSHGEQFFTLCFLYSDFRPSQLHHRLIMLIDHASFNIMRSSGELVSVVQQKGLNFRRVGNINIKKKAEKRKKWKKVLETYRDRNRGNPLWRKLSTSRQAELIQEDLEQAGNKISHSYIRKMLREAKENGVLIDNDL
jgi:hypothetical protein